jgi:hypothetical protein
MPFATKMFCKVFHENKKLNLELKSASSEIAYLRSAHDDMSAKPCDKCNMIMVNYANLWLVHSHIASLLDDVRLELRELKPCSTLLGDWDSCTLLRSDLEATAIEIKNLKHKLYHPSRNTVLSPHVKHVFLSRVSFFMLSKRTPSYNRRSLI